MSHMLGLEQIREFNFSKLNHRVPKSVNFSSATFSTSALSPAEKPKEKLNFSILNYNIQSIYFRARTFIASSHLSGCWEVKNEFNFSRVNFKVLKSVNFSSSHIRHVRSLSCQKREQKAPAPCGQPAYRVGHQTFSFHIFLYQSMKQSLYARD